MSLTREFFDFMNERHRIYTRKTAGEPWPWTEDPILREYAFTNVYRELDRVTIWVRENIREMYAGHPNLFFMLCIARQINWPDTLREMMLAKVWPEEEWNWEQAAEVLDRRKARGDKVYTGAYMIRAESDPFKSWYRWTKQQYLCGIVLERVWKARQLAPFIYRRETGDSCTLQRATEWLMQFHGWGPFMAYEVVTDLRHTWYLQNAPDIRTWANAGPGAKRGLNRIFLRPVKAALFQSSALEEMQQLLAWSRDYTPLDLEMREIEHTLCEFDKYMRVKTGEGRPRARYKHANN